METRSGPAQIHPSSDIHKYITYTYMHMYTFTYSYIYIYNKLKSLYTHTYMII